MSVSLSSAQQPSDITLPTGGNPTEQLSLDDGVGGGSDADKLTLTPPPLALKPDAVQRRATEASFGLGADSPGVSTIANSITTGTDDVLRDAHSRKLEMAERNRRMMMVREMAERQQGPVTAEQADQIMRIGTTIPKVDPSIVWENQYSRAVINNLLTAASKNVDIIGRAFGLNSDKAFDMTDAAQDMITKSRINQNIREELDIRIGDKSFLGKASDFLEGFIPGKAWVQLKDAAQMSKLEGLPNAYGSTMADVVKNLAVLPPSEYKTRVKEITDYLADRNIFEAQKFLNALDSYTGDDATIDNLFAALDVATAPGVGLLAKGVKNVAKAVGTEKTAASVVGKALTEPEAVTATKRFGDFLKRAVRSHTADGPVQAEKVLAEVGNLKTSAEVQVLKDAVEAGARDAATEFGAHDPLKAAGTLSSRMLSWFNPKVMMDNTNLGAEAARRLTTTMEERAGTIVRALTRTNTLDRLTPEALRVGFDEAWDAVRVRYNHVNDAVIDVKPIVQREIRPEDNPIVNTGAVQVVLGKTDGTLFDGQVEAMTWARDFYKLGDDYRIEQIGQGWGVTLTKYVDETSPAVREALLISTKNRKEEGGLLGALFRGLRTADDTVPEFQRQNRKQLVTGLNNIEKAAQEVAVSIRGLSKEQRNRLRDTLEKNRDAVIQTADGPVYGDFYNNVLSYEKDYKATYGHFPSEKEVEAYFSVRQLYDMDYLVRNATLFRDKVRQGIEEVSLNHWIVTSEGKKVMASMDLNGGAKFVDNLPWNQKDWSVYVHTNDPDNPGHVYKATQLFGDERKVVEDALANGFRVIQVANPNWYPLEKILGKRVPVNYVLTPDYTRKPLQWTQIPYQQGGHKSYATEWFVKQPKIVRTVEEGTEGVEPRTSHTFEGDTSIMGFATEAEAKKYAGLMDQARVLYKNRKIPELKDFLEKNLPFNYEKFKSLFTSYIDENGKLVEAKLHVDDPITHTFTGRRTSDDIDYSKMYPEFTDNIRSPHNLWANIDKEYAGQKNEDLWTVDERTPIFNLGKAEKIDPLKTLNDSVANIMRNRMMQDYKISAVETWIQEFGDLIKGADKDLMRANPVYYLHNGILDSSNPNVARLKLAEAQRTAILNLVGTKSDLAGTVEAIERKLADFAYEKFGQQAGNTMAFSSIFKEVDPFKYARQVAFYSKLALFNPVQLFLQAQTLTHVMAIAGPVNGMAGTGAGALMSFLRYTEKENIINSFAQKAKAFGMTPAQFKESYLEMRRQGIWHVEGENSWVSDTLDPKVYRGAVGSFLDKSAVFFKEGERITRMAAWNAAYLEWRKANPTAVIDNAVRRQLADRTNMLTVNMTRDANASWQQGIFSVPTQFLGYQTRLTEQLLGKRLTKTEQARALATYSLMYGLPGGVAAFTGAIPFVPDGNDIRQGLLERGGKWMGMDIDDTAVDYIMNGITSASVHLLTGNDYNLAERWGPNNMWKELLKDDKQWYDIAMGASGSIIGDILKSGDPFAKAITSVFSSDSSTQYTPQAEDFLALANNVSTVSQATKTIWALNTGLYFSKNGVHLTEISPWSAIWTGLTGTSPREVSDMNLMTQSLKGTKDAQATAQKFITTYFQRATQAAAKDDWDTYENYMRLVKIHFIAGGFQDKDRGTVLQKASSGLLNVTSKIKQDFWKNAPKEQQGARFNKTFNMENTN